MQKRLQGFSVENLIHTTNNRMELTSVIETLESVSGESEIFFYTDSLYVKNGITQWINNWIKNN